MMNLKSLLPSLAIVLLCIGFLHHQHPKRLEIIRSSYELEAPPPLSQLEPQLTNIFVLGFKNIYDDFISIWIMQSLIDSRARDVEKLIKSVDLVMRQEPKLETTYLLACFVLYKDFSRPDKCKDIILSGLRAFPKSWRLPMTQGYVSYFLLNEPAQAASFFMMAASRPNSPPYVQRLVTKLIQENRLEPRDIDESLLILERYGGSEAFKNILNSIGSSQKSLQEKADQ